MAEPVRARRLTDQEGRRLLQIVRRGKHGSVRVRRAMIIMTSASGTPAQRHANQALSAARAPVEHGFSDLKNWRILTRLRLSPANATMLLRALLVLTRRHNSR